MSDTEKNIAIFALWMEAHLERDVDKMLSFVTDDIVIRRSGFDFAPEKG